MPDDPAPRWMRFTLTAAGIYNLAWGAAVVLFPAASYEFGGLARPGQPLVNVPVWQCVGMVVGVYGVGYLIAATDPLRHWPVVLVGFLGKVFGPIGMAWSALRGELPWSAGVTNVFNDLIWWWPFAVILWRARVNAHGLRAGGLHLQAPRPADPGR